MKTTHFDNKRNEISDDDLFVAIMSKMDKAYSNVIVVKTIRHDGNGGNTMHNVSYHIEYDAVHSALRKMIRNKSMFLFDYIHCQQIKPDFSAFWPTPRRKRGRETLTGGKETEVVKRRI